LYASFRGQGIASEAVRLAEQLAARIFDARELVIRTNPTTRIPPALALRLAYQHARQTDDDEGVLDWYTLQLPSTTSSP
jgi:RimJ/RimL family protein N-acetyltransferase